MNAIIWTIFITSLLSHLICLSDNFVIIFFIITGVIYAGLFNFMLYIRCTGLFYIVNITYDFTRFTNAIGWIGDDGI